MYTTKQSLYTSRKVGADEELHPFLTCALDGVSNQHHPPAAVPPGKNLGIRRIKAWGLPDSPFRTIWRRETTPGMNVFVKQTRHTKYAQTL
jgi:hypothetical protein